MTTAIKFTKEAYTITLGNGSKDKADGYTFSHEGIQLGVSQYTNGWIVTELKTGSTVSGKFAMPTRKAAAAKAIAEIESLGLETFKKAIGKNLKHQEELKEVKQEEQESESERLVKEALEKDKADDKERRKKELAEQKKKAREEMEERNRKQQEEQAKRMKEEQENKAKAEAEEKARIEAERLAKEQAKAEQEKAQAEKESKPKKKWSIGQFFRNIASLEELKKAYKKFAKWLHPDVSEYENADEAFKALQDQYEKAEQLIKRGKKVEPEEQATQDVPLSDFLKDAIAKVDHLEGIEIKVKGTWVWIAGVDRKDYEAHKVLKSAGFRFGSKALEWYLADETNGTKKRKGRGYTADEISEKFGEVKVKEASKQGKKQLKGAM